MISSILSNICIIIPQVVLPLHAFYGGSLFIPNICYIQKNIWLPTHLLSLVRLKKIANVTKKIDPDAPHNVILVLDATSGQNIINQVEEFNKIIPITGIIMTKLDGTAKGGILLALAKKYKLPIIALGLGEKEDDLQLFDAEKFAEAFTQIN